ncbi:MAG: LEA type 2 family protein [Bacteroidia bacterium]
MLRTLYILGLGLLVLLAACDGPQKPEFRKMEKVNFKSVSFKGPLTVTLSGDAVFFNPNAIGADVTEVDLDVFVNEKKVTRVKQNVSASMSGNAEFRLPLEFDVPLKEVFGDAKLTLNDIFKKKLIEYKLVGNIKVGLGSVEFKVPVEYADEEEVKLR